MRLTFPFLLFFCLFTAAFAGAQTIPSYVSISGLAAWYPFTGNANDISGHGYNAAVNGPTLTTDRFGRNNAAYSFNGTSNYLRVGMNPNSLLDIRSNSFTISLWFKADFKTYTGDMQLFWRGDTQPGADEYMLMLSNGNANFRRDVGTGSTSNIVSYSLSTVDTGLWHHFVGSYDSSGDKMTIYFDGLAVTQAVKPGDIQYTTANHYNIIGAVDLGNSQNFRGKIDDIGVWNRVLSQCEITQLYSASTTLINSQPTNVTVAAGSPASFTINDVSPYATYQWKVNTGSGFTDLSNGGPYSGVNSKTLTINPATAAMDGYQYGCVRNGGGCVESSGVATLKVTSGGTTGVANTAAGAALTLYPNPNKGRFSISTGGALPGGEALIDITDMTGRAVYHDRCALTGGKAELDYSSRLAPGVYLLKLRAGGAQASAVFSVALVGI